MHIAKISADLKLKKGQGIMKPFQIRIRQKCDIMREKLCDSNMKQILDYFDLTLREKCPNTEFFLVRIFPQLD